MNLRKNFGFLKIFSVRLRWLLKDEIKKDKITGRLENFIVEAHRKLIFSQYQTNEKT